MSVQTAPGPTCSTESVSLSNVTSPLPPRLFPYTVKIVFANSIIECLPLITTMVVPGNLHLTRNGSRGPAPSTSMKYNPFSSSNVPGGVGKLSWISAQVLHIAATWIKFVEAHVWCTYKFKRCTATAQIFLWFPRLVLSPFSAVSRGLSNQFSLD